MDQKTEAAHLFLKELMSSQVDAAAQITRVYQQEGEKTRELLQQLISLVGMRDIFPRPPRFTSKGGQHPKVWLFRIENYIHGVQVPPEEQVRLASSYLDDYALTWFMLNEKYITNFEEFKKAFLRQFREPLESERAYHELTRLRQGQGKGSYRKYEMRFLELLVKLDFGMSEVSKFHHFFQGLDVSLKRKVLEKEIPEEEQTLTRIQQVARLADAIQWRFEKDVQYSRARARDQRSDEDLLEHSEQDQGEESEASEDTGECIAPPKPNRQRHRRRNNRSNHE